MSGVLVPIAFFAMFAAIFVAPYYFRYRERERMHDTLKIAFERGQAVPPELIAALQRDIVPPRPSAPATRERDLRRGLFWAAWGLGLCCLGYGLWYGLMAVDEEAAYITGGSVAGFGAIPGMVGLAYLLLWVMRRNTPDAGI